MSRCLVKSIADHPLRHSHNQSRFQPWRYRPEALSFGNKEFRTILPIVGLARTQGDRRVTIEMGRKIGVFSLR